MRAIFFDLDGTLLELRRDYRDVLAETFEAVAGEVRAEWLETYSERFFELFEACEPNPVERAFRDCNRALDAETLAERHLQTEIEAMAPPADVHEELQRLGDAYELGVLSNGMVEWQRRKLDAHGLSTYFDTILVSYEVGVHKPDERLYHTAEDRLPADAYAMVGDADTDVEGARRVGWDACRYDGGGFDDIPGVLNWSR